HHTPSLLWYLLHHTHTLSLCAHPHYSCIALSPSLQWYLSHHTHAHSLTTHHTHCSCAHLTTSHCRHPHSPSLPVSLPAHLWVKNCRELLPSSSRPSRFDQPIQASQWLRNFRVTNERFLSQIKTTRQYVWSKRESTDAGRPLGELVDQGLTRVKSSSDVASALMRELRGQCGGGAFRLAVAVDGVNALWGRTALRKEDKSPVRPS
uniref:Small ribosomal subunit protein mS29 n=1 Tax=Lepisosteus oculatus TaxID=7918 RepID=W5MH32_LEPOC